MSPVLAEAARDLHVSTAAAGQLRTVTGLVAGITALLLGRASRAHRARPPAARRPRRCSRSGRSRARRRRASRCWPLAQVPVGVAVAVLTTAGTLAAAEWVAPERRTRTLSWALVGQPAAWIVGMPLIGLVGERSWRYGWLALPLVAAVAGRDPRRVARAGSRPPASRPARARAALGDRALARWLASRAARERGLGGNARLRGRALRRVVRHLHRS